MTPTEQMAFIKALSYHVCKYIVDDIQAGKVPETWDGYELRQLVADRFEAAIHVGGGLSPKRRREYNNTVIVNDL